MLPPLTSLSWIDWAIFSDFCADYRPKAEPFARKVVRSLMKMEAVGCDPRMRIGVWLVGRQLSDLHIVVSMGWGFETKAKINFDRLTTDTDGRLWRGKYSSVRWFTGSKSSQLGCGSEVPYYSPADLPVHWQQTRLAWKFWKCVNRRALGIRDDVLEGLC